MSMLPLSNVSSNTSVFGRYEEFVHLYLAIFINLPFGFFIYPYYQHFFAFSNLFYVGCIIVLSSYIDIRLIFLEIRSLGGNGFKLTPRPEKNFFKKPNFIMG